MLANYIFGKTETMIKSHFLLIFILYWKWAQKRVFKISDI